MACIQESGQCAVAVSGGALQVVSQRCWVNVKRLSRTCWGAHFSISKVTPSSPGAFPIFILASARVSSGVVGVSLSHCAGMGLVGALSQTRSATGTAPFCILLK